PGVHYAQQEQDHLLQHPTAVSPHPINPTNFVLSPATDTQHNNRFLRKINKNTPMIQMIIKYKETRIAMTMIIVKRKKGRGRGKIQSQAQLLLSSHRPIQESTQSKLKIPGQRRGKIGAANGTINPSAQSSRIKQIAGGSDYNFGSCVDIDMEQMMERDLTQTQPTTNDGPVVSTAPTQLGMAQCLAERETASVFAAQRTKTEILNFGNE
ncbi:MAG: hypothetical protein EZS28_049672, partial [Streblomastix strix]